MPLSLAGCLAALALSAVEGSASGEEVVGTRFPVVERSHSIEVKVDRGTATLVVTRVVHNPGPRSDQAIFFVDLPAGAVATRMRTAGVNAQGEPVWFEGELMEAEAAAHKYQELTGIGGYYPKDPALLSWKDQGHLRLQVFPVPPSSTKTVQYTLTIPLTYEGGHYKAKLPPIGTETLPATLQFSAARGEDIVRVNGVPVAPGSKVSATREVEIDLGPRAVPRVDAPVASIELAKDRFLVHTRVAVAPRLGEVPGFAAVAVVIDTSRSMENDIEPALAAARAYLSHFPAAEVEIVSFDRRTATPFPHAMSAPVAIAKLHGWKPKLGNGSQLDDAIARADQLLLASRAPVRRMLVLTDLSMRDALSVEKIAQRPLASGALVHVATVHEASASIARDDEDAWAALPRRTGGLLWRASAQQESSAAQTAVFEEWVRPMRIEKVAVNGMPAAFVAPDELHEGTGLEHLAIESTPVRQLALEGELWSRRVRYTFAPTAEENKRWSALVFGSPLLSELSEDEMMPLAMRGRAVSPVTSYLAIEPGVRPSTDGLEDTAGIGDGAGDMGSGIGLGNIGTIGHGSGTGWYDHVAFLRRALTSAMMACGLSGPVSVKVETTADEIVDVTDLTLLAHDAKEQACVKEGLWAVDLPGAFRGHTTWPVAVP